MKSLLASVLMTALVGPTVASAAPGDTWICKETTNDGMKCKKILR